MFKAVANKNMHCEKQLVCLLFDFGIVNTKDADCSTLLSTDSERRAPFITVDNIGSETTVFSVDNSCGLMAKSNRRP